MVKNFKGFKRVFFGIATATIITASIATVGVSATTSSTDYIENVTPNNVKHHTINSTKNSTHLDVFGNYPDITGASSSTVKSWVTDTNFKYTSAKKTQRYRPIALQSFQKIMVHGLIREKPIIILLSQVAVTSDFMLLHRLRVNSK